MLEHNIWAFSDVCFTLDWRCHSYVLWRATSTSRCSVKLAWMWRRRASWWVQSDKIVVCKLLTLWTLICWFTYAFLLPRPDNVWRCQWIWGLAQEVVCFIRILHLLLDIPRWWEAQGNWALWHKIRKQQQN